MMSRYRCVVAILLLCAGASEAAKICRSTSIPFHTWVHMDYRCSDAGSACTSSTPWTQWNDIGYENGNGGTLRDESKNPGGVYACTNWFVGDAQGKVAMAASAVQERSTIAALVAAGWQNARYGLIGGLTSVTCDPTSSAYKPRSSMNVCWTFTCAYSAYLYQVHGVRPRAYGSQLSVSGIADGDIPSAWTCKPEQYGSGDGCQCTCGAFDPDCNPMAAVSLDCPNRGDICIPGSQNGPVCMPRHEVLSDRKSLQIATGVPVHNPFFFFSNDTDVDGAPWGNYGSAFTRDDVPPTWTCNRLFYGSNDGCDCECGAWDPDCDATASSAQKVFNCDTNNPEVRCAMSKTVPSEPVCLYDRMAASASMEAGFTSDSAASNTIPTTTVIAASVGSTLAFLALVAAIALFIHRRRRASRPQQNARSALL